MQIVKEDIYLTMLRFGRLKLKDQHGFTINEFIEYMHKEGFADLSEKSIILHHYFKKVFFSNEEYQYPPEHWVRHFLKPECYMQLLDYESMNSARKEARTAKWFSIAALLLSVISIIISLYR